MKCLLLSVICCVVSLSLGASKDDAITYLPGLTKQPNFDQYSGYLSALGKRQLHYWFVESQASPKTDPLIIWTNGGPGCSSMLGILSENGPFLVNQDGMTLEYNDNSWNEFANVLYIESPAGVGFSYAPDGNVTTSDDQITEDHYAALLDFYQAFPAFKANKLFVIGESYSGVYTPLLSAKILKEIDVGSLTGVTLGGFAIGNGVTSYKMTANSLLYYLHYHGILGDKTWNSLMTNCCDSMGECNFYAPTNPDCTASVNAAVSFYGSTGLNMYNILADCEGSSAIRDWGPYGYRTELGDLYDGSLFDTLKIKEKMQKPKAASHKVDAKLGMTPPCLNYSNVATYLNNAYTKTALHIATNLSDWACCSAKVSVSYQRIYDDLTPVYSTMLKNLQHKLRLLVYSGDLDTAVNFLGNEWFVDALGAEDEVQWRQWMYNDGSQQVAGFIKEYQGIAFATVKGAGHMAPQDKPIATSLLIRNFVTDKPY